MHFPLSWSEVHSDRDRKTYYVKPGSLRGEEAVSYKLLKNWVDKMLKADKKLEDCWDRRIPELIKENYFLRGALSSLASADGQIAGLETRVVASQAEVDQAEAYERELEEAEVEKAEI